MVWSHAFPNPNVCQQPAPEALLDTITTPTAYKTDTEYLCIWFAPELRDTSPEHNGGNSACYRRRGNADIDQDLSYLEFRGSFDQRIVIASPLCYMEPPIIHDGGYFVWNRIF